MRVGYTSDREKEKKKKDKKKQQSILEKEIMSIMEKGMKAALDRAIDDLLKDWKYESAAAVASKSQNPRVGDS